MKIRAVVAELFHAGKKTDGWTEGQTWRHFSQFCQRA